MSDDQPAVGCDHSRVEAFLNSDGSDLSDDEFLRHLDDCDNCREYLEHEAADVDVWEKLRHHLTPRDYDVAGVPECSAATAMISQKNNGADTIINALAPTDNPHHLGRLGGHEITGVVGVGGMGVVLKAIDPALDRVVAIKVMAPHLANNATARRRFSREAKAAAAVLHPNVIPIHCVSSEGAIPHLVMAYIRGGSLQKRLDREGPLPTVEILRIGSQVAAGLAAAHEQGLVHRDIKPENILLEEGVERVTLTDFGLAHAVDDVSVTREGTIAGTPQYMSPEQARGESVDQQSDLFSLGSVLYALCTGRAPFRAESTYGVMRLISDNEAVPIRELNPEIPDWLSTIIERLMAKQKPDRFSSAEEVHKLLEACLNHVQHPTVVELPAELTTATDFGEPSRRRAATMIASLLFLVLMGVIYYIQTDKGIVHVNAIHSTPPDVFQQTTVPGLRRLELPSPVVDVSPDETMALIVDEFGVDNIPVGRPRIWSLQTNRELSVVPALEGFYLRFVPGTRSLCMAGDHRRQQVRFWDIENGTWFGDWIDHDLRGGHKPMFWPIFSPDGRTVSLASLKGEMQFWNLSGKQPVEIEPPTDKPLPKSDAPKPFYKRQFSSDGKYCFAEFDDKLYVLDPVTATTLAGPFPHRIARGLGISWPSVLYNPTSETLVTIESSAEIKPATLRFRSARKNWESVHSVTVTGKVGSVSFLGTHHVLSGGLGMRKTDSGFQTAQNISTIIPIEPGDTFHQILAPDAYTYAFAPDGRQWVAMNTSSVYAGRLGQEKTVWKQPLPQVFQDSHYVDYQLSIGNPNWVVSRRTKSDRIAIAAYSLNDGRLLLDKSGLKHAVHVKSTIAVGKEVYRIFPKVSSDDIATSKLKTSSRPVQEFWGVDTNAGELPPGMTAKASLVTELNGHQKDVWAVGFGEENRTCWTAGRDTTVRKWNIQTGEQLSSTPIRNRWGVIAMNHPRVSFCPELQRISIFDPAGAFGSLHLLPDGKQVREFPAWKKVLATSFSPDGKLLAVAGWRKFPLLRNANTGDVIFNSNDEGMNSTLAWTPDATRLILGTWGRHGETESPARIRVINTEDPTNQQAFGKMLLDFPVKDRVENDEWIRTEAVASSPDGKQVIAIITSTEGLALDQWYLSVQKWDLKTGEAGPIIRGRQLNWKFKNLRQQVFFSPDAKFFAVVSGKTVQVWETATATHLMTITNPHEVTTAAFSSDNEFLSVATAKGNTAILRLTISRTTTASAAQNVPETSQTELANSLSEFSMARMR